ncbi:PREDICTED: acyl-CoA synthetase family member 2, mitochondrial-like, partial [Rhagoletis zephyria]|uniref:acyl-CoA synthetase family member 2, mitochondrial-like n=1 Tax=Rhagoletis zephyria TaxID=28612 RepID=UPI0008115979
MAFKLLRSNLALTLPQTRPRATLLPVSVRLLSTRPRKQWQLHEPHQISYEQGLPKDSTVSRFNASTLGELLEKATLETPEKTLFIVHHQNLAKTYQQFNDDVDQLAKGLLAIGCRRGDPVGIWAVNSYEWLLVQFATAKIGVIFVTINPGYKAQELVNCINLVGLKTLISNQHFRTSNYVETLNTVSPSLLSTAKGCKVQSKELPSLENLIFMDEAEETAPSYVMRFSELLDKGAGDKKLSELIEPKERTTFDDVINVQFTSGTTGTPKGAMLNHSNIVNNAHFLAPRMYEG